MPGRVEGKVAVITGAGSGIGETTAHRYAAEGAAVICLDLAGADRVAEEIRASSGEAIAVAADVSHPDDVERGVRDALDAYGAIDVLYANAGIAGAGTASDCTVEQWDRVIAVNLTGVWLSMKAVLPHMRARRQGAIVNQASIGGIVGVPGIAPYAAAKAGVIGLTRQAAVDVGVDNVRVNAIAPGTAPTPLVTATWEARGGISGEAGDLQEAQRRTAQHYPLGRLGTTDDVASLALFLGSDEATWITGQVHVIDGGYTAR